MLLLTTLAILPTPPAIATDQLTQAYTTSYCLSGTTSDGTRLDTQHPTTKMLKTVASNRHPLGTLIKLKHPVFGRKFFRVHDHIGHGTELDIWNPSCKASRIFGVHPAFKYEVR